MLAIEGLKEIAAKKWCLWQCERGAFATLRDKGLSERAVCHYRSWRAKVLAAQGDCGIDWE
jgi:hypothetical protein